MHSRILPDISDRIPAGVQRDGQDSDIAAKFLPEHFGGVGKQLSRPRAGPITAGVKELKNHPPLTNHFAGGCPPLVCHDGDIQELCEGFRALNLLV